MCWATLNPIICSHSIICFNPIIIVNSVGIINLKAQTQSKTMAKYKIEREYIFSNKSYNEINDFLREYSKIDLKAVCDQKGNTALHQAAYSCDDIRVLKRYLEYMEKYCCEN